MINPVPELRGAHAQIALGNAGLQKRRGQLAPRRSGERIRAERNTVSRRQTWFGKARHLLRGFLAWLARFLQDARARSLFEPAVCRRSSPPPQTTGFEPVRRIVPFKGRLVMLKSRVDHRIAPPMFAAAFLMLLLATPSNAAQAQQAPTLKDSVPTITTNGEASAEVVPDIATISLGVDTERPKAADAARENARAAQAVVNEIKAQGIDAKDIKTVSVTLAPVYDEERDDRGYVTKRTLRGYSASNSLHVRIKDIGKAGTLASQMLDKGANRVDGISYDYSQKDEKYDALRAVAVRDALRKAKSYVDALGIKLGRVLEIGSRPHEAPMPAAMAPRMRALFTAH